MSNFQSIQVLLGADNTNLKQVMMQSSAAVKGFEKDVKAAGATGASAGKMLTMGLAAGAMAVAVGFGYAIAKAVEFDRSMRNVNSISKMSEEQFAATEKQVIAMSKTLPQSAKELADGLYDIASSGFQGADGLTILKASAEAASAGLSTTAVASKAITATINAYGLTAKDAADISDVLFQTVNLGVVSFEELSGALGDVIGGAAAAGVSIDQVGSAIATMTLAGIGGNEAATSLNRLITSIIKPSDALKTLFKQLGYESGEAALKQKGLRGVMEDVRKSTGGNVTALLDLFPEIRAARGAFGLLSNDGKTYAKVSAEITDKTKRQGATLAALKEQMKGVGLQWDVMKNGINGVAIELGTKLLPYLTSGMKSLADFGSGAADLWKKLEPLQEGARTVGEAVMALGQFIAPVIGDLVKLGGAVAVGALILFGEILSSVAGFIKDHAELVSMLAIAYGVKLVAAMVLAQGGLSVIAWKTFSAVLVGAITGVDGLAAALKGLVTMESAATLGIAAVITLGITAWNSYSGAIDDSKKSVEDLRKAVDKGDYTALVKAATDSRQEWQSMSDFITAQQNKVKDNWLTLVFDIKGTAQGAAFADQIGTVAKVAEDAGAKLQHVRDNVLAYLAATTQLKGEAKDSWMMGLIQDTEKMDKATVDLAARAKLAGVDLNGTYGSVKAGLDAYTASSQTAEGKQRALIAAMGDVSSTGKTAADGVDALKNALDGLLGVALNQEEATSKWEESLDKLTEGIKKNTKAAKDHKLNLDLDTQAGRDNRGLVRDTVKSLQDKLVADAAAGASAKELSHTFADGTIKLYKQADAAGINKQKMTELLTTYNLTPDLVQTIVQAIGTGKSEDEIRALITATGGVPATKTVRLNVDGTVASSEQIAAMDAQIVALKGKQIDVGVIGTSESQLKVHDLQTEIDILIGKRVEISESGAPDAQAQVAALNDKITVLHGKQIEIGQKGAADAKGQVAELQSQIDHLQGKDVHINYVLTVKGQAAAAAAAAKGDSFHRPSKLGGLLKRAGGGLLSGPGTGTSDSIMGIDPYGRHIADVSTGEFVVNAKQTAKHRSLIEAVNAGKFATGGVVGSAAKAIGTANSRYVKTDLIGKLTGAPELVESATSARITSGFDKTNAIIIQLAATRGAAAKALSLANGKITAAAKGMTAAERALTAAGKDKKRIAAAQAKVDAAREVVAAANKARVGALKDVKEANAAIKIAAAMTQQATAAEKQLKALGDSREALAEQVVAATDKLIAAQKQMDDYASQVANQVGAKGALNDLFGSGDIKMGLNSYQQVVDQRKQLVDATLAFKDQIDRLDKAGLSKPQLEEIINMGIGEGSRVAAAILAGGPDAVQALNDSSKELADAAEQLGIDASEKLYGAGVQAAQGLVAGLESQRGAIEALMVSIAMSIQAAIKGALAIQSPSKVMRSIGQQTGQGAVLGLGDKIPAMEAQARRFAIASMPRVAAGANFSSQQQAAPALPAPISLTVKVQNPWTGEYHEQKMAGVVDKHLEVVMQGAS